MNRTEKIKNLELALDLMEDQPFTVEGVYTSLSGPSLNIVTKHYNGTVTVEFGDSSIVRLTTDGYTQRFADSGQFLTFFANSLQAPTQDVLDVSARLLGSHCIGANQIVFRNASGVYLLVKVQHGFEVNHNNERFLLSASDAVKMLGGNAA